MSPYCRALLAERQADRIRTSTVESSDQDCVFATLQRKPYLFLVESERLWPLLDSFWHLVAGYGSVADETDEGQQEEDRKAGQELTEDASLYLYGHAGADEEQLPPTAAAKKGGGGKQNTSSTAVAMTASVGAATTGVHSVEEALGRESCGYNDFRKLHLRITKCFSVEGQFEMEAAEAYALLKWRELIGGNEVVHEGAAGGGIGKAQLCDCVYSYFFSWLVGVEDAEVYEQTMKAVLDEVRVRDYKRERRDRRRRWAMITRFILYKSQRLS